MTTIFMYALLAPEWLDIIFHLLDIQKFVTSSLVPCEIEHPSFKHCEPLRWAPKTRFSDVLEIGCNDFD